MIDKLLAYLIKEPKTEIEMAVELIEGQQFIGFNKYSTSYPDDAMFIVTGTMRHGRLADCVKINFTYKDKGALIKHNGSIAYYFETKEEVKQIRGALKTVYNKQSDKPTRIIVG